MFGMLWEGETPTPSKQVAGTKPAPSNEPFDERIQTAKLTGRAEIVNDSASVPEAGMNQSHFIKKAGVTLALFFERLPQCLGELPFVEKDQIPAFPYALEKGIRPAGNFFDHFEAEDEQVTWAYAVEDFELLGYKRYNPDLPAESPNALVVG